MSYPARAEGLVNSTFSLPLLPAPLWPGGVLPDMGLDMGHLNGVQINDILNWIVRNRTVCSFNYVSTND